MSFIKLFFLFLSVRLRSLLRFLFSFSAFREGRKAKKILFLALQKKSLAPVSDPIEHRIGTWFRDRTHGPDIQKGFFASTCLSRPSLAQNSFSSAIAKKAFYLLLLFSPCDVIYISFSFNFFLLLSSFVSVSVALSALLCPLMSLRQTVVRLSLNNWIIILTHSHWKYLHGIQEIDGYGMD